MFEGYDPEMRPPYEHICYKEVNGTVYKFIYLVSNGYGGSRIISYRMEKPADEKEEERNMANEDQRED